MKAIINIEDEVVGSWHQITFEKEPGYADGYCIRFDGTILPYDSMIVKEFKRLVGAFEDQLEGVTDKQEYI